MDGHDDDQEEGAWTLVAGDEDQPVQDEDGGDVEKKGKSKRKKRERKAEESEARPSEKKRERLDEPTMGEFDDRRTVFAGGVPYQASKDDISKFFGEAGVVSRVRMLQFNGKSNGAAFVEFATEEEARRGVEMDGELFLQRPVRVNMVSDKPGARKGHSIYVGNLAFSTSEKLLRAIFGHCGEILALRLPLFRDTGRLRGFAVIDLDTEAAVGRAVRLNGMKVEGREIRVEVMAKPPPEASKKKAIPAFRRSEEEKMQKAKKDKNREKRKNKK